MERIHRLTNRFSAYGTTAIKPPKNGRRGPPLNAVEALASRPEVRYISTDRQIASQGHLENTTGTAAARAQTTTSLLGLVTTNVFDGRGVTIAIVDSGIDENHVSFRDAFGFSRVIARQDFTGENRTDDPYGHG